jgi:DNA helicase-2/ATP-dependent DNA helicase PcrA
LDDTGYREHLGKEKDERTTDRLENIEELLSAAEAFENEQDKSETDEKPDLVPALLDRAALVSDQDRSEDAPDAVMLMTIHSAKGLEYPAVFVTGLEEGVFPHSRSLDEDEQVEEERRLCYVAITRAREQLFLSRSRVRRVYGADSMFRAASRFLQELPEQMRPRDYHFGDSPLYEERRAAKATEPAWSLAPESGGAGKSGELAEELDLDEGGTYFLPDPGEGEYSSGMVVRHGRYGVGRVASVEGRGAHAKIAVDFESAGRKKFIAGMANLEIRLDT